MRATLLYGAGDIRVETTPDPTVQAPTDAVVRVVRAAVCGTDLHDFHDQPASETGTPIGHEFIGLVGDTGAAVSTVSPGDLVVGTFASQDNTCELCRAGVQTSCVHGGYIRGAQAELVHVPQADGTLVRLPDGLDAALLPSVLTLADVYGTGYHAAHRAGVTDGDTVVVIGDGAVGLLAVLAARQRGADRIVLMGRHQDRTDLGRQFGATDVVAGRGADGVAAVHDLTRGGASKVLEAVGAQTALEQALGVVRPGGVISRVGVPKYDALPSDTTFLNNTTITGGVAPVRAYLDRLLPTVLDGTVQPGRVFTRSVSLDQVADGYRAMDERQALKVLVEI